jgi:hypothetical protein
MDQINVKHIVKERNPTVDFNECSKLRNPSAADAKLKENIEQKKQAQSY